MSGARWQNVRPVIAGTRVPEVTVPRTDMTTSVGLLVVPWLTASASTVYQGPNPAG